MERQLCKGQRATVTSMRTYPSYPYALYLAHKLLLEEAMNRKR
jgi:hypothetical protein